MESLRIVLTADTHLGFDLPAHPRVERRRRGEDFFANYERVLRHARLSRPALLVHGGDVFFRSRLAPAVVDRAFSALAGLADDGVPSVIAPGNHDRSRLPGSLWLGHPGVHVLDRPRTFLFEAGGARFAVGGFPFLRADLREQFAVQLAATELGEAPASLRLLCLHQAVAGAAVGPAGFRFRAGRDVIAGSAFPPWLTAVLAGHVHRAQVLGGERGPPVYYPGSIERTSVAERDEAKGFFDLTFARAGGGAWGVAEAHFIALPSRPMVDLVIPAGLAPRDLAAHLAGRVRALHPEAVVRLAGAEGADPGLARWLTARLLGSLFPPSMSVYLARSLVVAAR